MIYSKSRIPEHLHRYFRPAEYGLESSPAEYVESMRAVFAEVRRVLGDDGTLWLNIGDSYSSKTKGSGGTGRSTLGAASGGHGISDAGILRSQERQQMSARAFNSDVPDKNLMGIPWRTAFALQDDGWILRNAIVWHKPNAMPESVTDRVSTRHELIFMFSKSRRYWFDLDAIREPLTYPDAADGSRIFGGKNKASELTTGSAARRTGGTYGGKGHGHVRPQTGKDADPSHSQVAPGGRNPRRRVDHPHQPLPRRTLRRVSRRNPPPRHSGRLQTRRHSPRPVLRVRHHRARSRAVGTPIRRHRPVRRIPRPVATDAAGANLPDRRGGIMTRTYNRMPEHEWVAEVEWLADQGQSIAGIAQALRVRDKSVITRLQRYGRNDLASRINCGAPR